MMRTNLWRACPALLLFVACGGEQGYGAGDDDGASQDAGSSWCFSSNECPTGWTCTEFGTCEPPPVMTSDGGVPPPPPPEVERDIGQPSSTLRYVYVAMTDLDALAKIDGATLNVTAVPVGDRPDLVLGVPGGDDAIVLDRGSSTATIVRPTVDRDERITLPTLPNLNSAVVAPAGAYAVAWFDLTKAVVEAGSIGGVDEVGSFQDVTLIGLRPGQEGAADLSVGFRPREVEFDAAGTHAYVITDDGVSVIDLEDALAGGAHVAATIPVAPAIVDPGQLEVEVTDDGAWAVVREHGQAMIRAVELGGPNAGATHDVLLPAEATDVDLVNGRAYAVLREASQLAILDIPEDALDPNGAEFIDLAGSPAGSIVVDDPGDTAILFTNASDVESVLVIDLVTYAIVTRPLEKGVRTVAFAPDGMTALVMHNKRPGDPSSATTVDEFVDLSYGYSLLDLATGFPKLAITPVDPGDVAFAPDSSRAYVALDGGDAEGAIARVEEIDLDTFVTDDHELGSPPERLGVLPGANVVYVSQRHPQGRVTFIDIATGGTRTVTGFELNSHIVD